jgi:hypothetical protein
MKRGGKEAGEIRFYSTKSLSSSFGVSRRKGTAGSTNKGSYPLALPKELFARGTRNATETGRIRWCRRGKLLR